MVNARHSSEGIVQCKMSFVRTTCVIYGSIDNTKVESNRSHKIHFRFSLFHWDIGGYLGMYLGTGKGPEGKYVVRQLLHRRVTYVRE